MKKNLPALIIFGIAFGFVEAVVVYYLRNLFNYGSNYPLEGAKILLNLGFMQFVFTKTQLLHSNQVTAAEIVREASTIAMLVSVAFLSAKNLKQWIGAFLIAFSTWDIFYYIFLRFLTGWPTSLFNTDVYFLVPVSSIGPILTPIIIFIVLFWVGLKLYSGKAGLIRI